MARGQSREVATRTATMAPPATQSEASAKALAVKSALVKQTEQIAAVLPKHLTPERMIQVVSTMVYKTPKLQECPTNTILASVMEACELGLELSSKLGEAYLVPFWNKEAKCNVCTMMPGYQGLVKLARQSEKVVYIEARIVHERDIFQVDYNPDLVFLHRPHLGMDRGERVLVYAVAKLTTGDHQIVYMTPDELEQVHQHSQGYKTAAAKGWKETGPWVDWRPEQEKKTAIKRLCKVLPRSPRLLRAIELDDSHYSLERVTPEPQRAVPGLSRSEMLARQLAGPPADEPEFSEGTSGVIATEADEVAPAGDDDFEEGVNC